jgi:hypothetical protein
MDISQLFYYKLAMYNYRSNLLPIGEQRNREHNLRSISYHLTRPRINLYKNSAMYQLGKLLPIIPTNIWTGGNFQVKRNLKSWILEQTNLRQRINVYN